MIKVAADYYHWDTINAGGLCLIDGWLGFAGNSRVGSQRSLPWKVKTLAVSQKVGTTKRQRLSDEITISLRFIEEDARSVLDIISRDNTFTVVATTWAI